MNHLIRFLAEVPPHGDLPADRCRDSFLRACLHAFDGASLHPIHEANVELTPAVTALFTAALPITPAGAASKVAAPPPRVAVPPPLSVAAPPPRVAALSPELSRPHSGASPEAVRATTLATLTPETGLLPVIRDAWHQPITGRHTKDLLPTIGVSVSRARP